MEKLMLALSILSGRVGADTLSEEDYAMLGVDSAELGGGAENLLELCELVIALAIVQPADEEAEGEIESEIEVFAEEEVAEEE